jgi:hypothetical protein
LGIVTVSDPSFEVPARRVIGNVVPPSVERSILTFAQLIGAVFVLATFHVIVCSEPAAQLTAELGEVTLKADPVFDTLKEIDE